MRNSKRSTALVLALCLGLAPLTFAAPSGDLPVKALERGKGVFDRAVFAHQMSDLHDRLVDGQVPGTLATSLRVELSAEDLDPVRNRPALEQKMKVGVVKELHVPVDFSDVRGTIVREQVREFGALRGNENRFVWSGFVISPGAAALRLHITDFFMPAGSELYVYTPAGMAFGPYTDLGPNGTGEFWTNTVVGADLIVQVHHESESAERPSFIISGAGHLTERFRLAATLAPQPQAGQQNCSFNEDCVIGAACVNNNSAVSTAEDAVAHILFRSGAWLYICSGGLVADSDSGSTIPYFVTANHCISKGGEASSLETFFFYTSSCGSCPGSGNPSTNGSSIVASNRTSDYTLLRLNGSAPSGAAYLGWDSNPIANSNGAHLYRLSHPKGAPQSYSEHDVDTNKPTCRSWPRGNWIYSRDVLGATEGGSSGSPVVNGSGQLVGQLSGACGFNVNDVCDTNSNATVDGAFAAYYDQVAAILGPGGGTEPDPEVCNDGVDNDGDGAIDCADGDCATDPACDSGGDCTDADGDGYTTCDGDCNDNDASINPGAKDRGGPRWSDGVDNDCDGVIDG